MSYIFFPSPTPVFPALPVLGWSVHKKPLMASRTATFITGRETQLACCVYPRWAFTLTYGGNSWLRDQTQNIVTDPTLAGLTEFEQISSLFLQCLGSYGEFYYSDPDDNSRMAQNVPISSDTQTTFPLYYSWGSGPFTPSLTIPVGGIQSLDAVYINGALVSPSTYSLDATNTQIIFTSAPGTGITITADFHFYFRCRFLTDTLSFSQFSQNLWELKEIQFESVKP
jgi:uncharacterized protein (TIGR02217 family)